MAAKKGQGQGRKPAPEQRLTQQHKLFALEYATDFDGARAARAAGFSGGPHARNTAYRLLQRPDIQALVAEAVNNAAETAGVNAVWVLRRLKETSDRCFQAEPVKDVAGNETGVYKFDAAGAIRGAELIGKHLKMFTDKVEHSGTVGVELNDAQGALAAILSSLARRAEPPAGDQPPQ
jgi:phage terminase small subunit